MAKDKTEATVTKTATAKEADTSKDTELLMESFELFWRIFHKVMRPCPTRFQVGKMIEQLRVRLGTEAEEKEKGWR